MILQVSSVFFCSGNSGRGSIIRPNVALGRLVVAFCSKLKPFQIDSCFFLLSIGRESKIIFDDAYNLQPIAAMHQILSWQSAGLSSTQVMVLQCCTPNPEMPIS